MAHTLEHIASYMRTQSLLLFLHCMHHRLPDMSQLELGMGSGMLTQSFHIDPLDRTILS